MALVAFPLPPLAWGGWPSPRRYGPPHHTWEPNMGDWSGKVVAIVPYMLFLARHGMVPAVALRLRFGSCSCRQVRSVGSRAVGLQPAINSMWVCGGLMSSFLSTGGNARPACAPPLSPALCVAGPAASPAPAALVTSASHRTVINEQHSQVYQSGPMLAWAS